MVSILFDFLPSKKIAPSLVRVEKNLFKIGRKGVSKEGEFYADFKNV
jgi:hypothetical protein